MPIKFAKPQRRKPIRSFNVYVLNVTLQSDTRGPAAYIRLIESLFTNSIRVPVKGGKAVLIRALNIEVIDDTTVLYGKIAKFTKIETDQWINHESKKIEKYEINQNLSPNATETDFYFLPEIHRFCLRRSPSVSITNVETYLSKSLPQVIASNEYISVNIEQSADIFSQITNAKAVTSLKIDISYTNDDEFDEDAANWMDAQLKSAHAGKVSIDLKPDHKDSLEIKESEFVSGALKIAQSNGNVIASITDNTNRKHIINTKDHPAQHQIRPKKDENLLVTLKRTIVAIFKQNTG